MNQPSPSADPEKDQRLNAVLAEYLKRKDAGRPVNQKALLAAYPDLSDALQSWFDGEALMAGGVLATTKLGKVPPRSSVRETVRPSTLASDTASEFSPRMFGRYQLLRPLGEGAMGSVFLAKDTTLDRQVALKVPKSEGTGNAEFMQRFTREAKAAAALKHPNICSVFDTGEYEGTAFITMDFIDGVPLSRFIGSSKLQSLESILRMLKTIAQAIEHAHSKGVIHRDLKPGNILVDEDFNPVVTDFGLARRVESSDESRITQEGLLIGTPAYMAPEQVKGEQAKVGTASDIYSLGVIFFEMLTCRLPFEGKISELLAKVLRDAPPIPSKIRIDLPEDVDDLCLKMMQKLPGHRYGSITDVIKAITLLQNKLKDVPAAPRPNAQQQSPFQIQKAHIELMLKKGQYAAAIQDLEKLAAEKSPGAKVVGEWARKTLITARAESKALSPAGLAALLQTAEQMFQKSDYLGCIQLLEDVPALRRTEGMEDLVKKARKREADAEELLADIKDLEHRQQVDGLEPLVKRFLKLKPGNSYGKRLLAALQSYSKTPASRRTYRYDKGRLQAMPEPSFVKQWAVLGSLVFVLVFLLVYSYVIFYLKSGNQTLAVHVDDEWLREQGGEVTLLVDGNSHTISAKSATGEDLSVVVTLGEHTFSVKHGDTVVHDPRTFQIEKDGRRILQITATDMQLTHSSTEPPVGSETVAKDVPRSTMTPIVSDVGEWTSLFDGADVSRWSTLGPFTVRDRLLIAHGGRANAVSREEYSDFELEADWRVGPGSNSGIYYRERASTAVLAGNEFQISGAQPENNKLIAVAGALYGVVPATEDASLPVGIWNTARIICRGTSVEHWLNGRQVAAYDTKSAEWKRQINESIISEDRTSIGTRLKGHILLQGMTGEVAFQSIRIRELKATANSNTSPLTAMDPSASEALPPLAIAPFNAIQAAQHQQAWATAINQPVEIQDSIGIKLRLIPPGEFSMGSPDSEKDRMQTEGPVHRVRLTRPSYMGTTEVTQSQWCSVMGTRPWEGDKYVITGDRLPAADVDYNDAEKFCEALSQKEDFVYRLPTEAEWEYACRAGTSTMYANGIDAEQLASIGNVADAAALAMFPDWRWAIATSDGYAKAAPVGQFLQNDFGLLDMQGNVAEFCHGMFDEAGYGAHQGIVVDPQFNTGSDLCVLRGGSAYDSGGWCRIAARNAKPRPFRAWTQGFRVIREIKKDLVTLGLSQNQTTDLDRIATGTWLPLVDSSTPLPDPERMKFNNGVLELETSIILPKLQVRDVIVRAEVKKISGQNLGITIRHSLGKEWTQAYAAWFNGTQSDGGDLFGIAKAMQTSVSLAAGNAGYSFEPDQFVDMAVSAIGDQISLFVEGKKVFSVTDADYGTGAIALGAFRGGKALFRNVRYQTLDPGGVTATAIDESTPSAIPRPHNDSLKHFSQIDSATKEELVTWSKSLPNRLCPNWISIQPTRGEPLFHAVALEPRYPIEWSLEFYDTNKNNDMETFEKLRFERSIEVFNMYKTGDTFERLTVWSQGPSTVWWHGSSDLVTQKIQEASQQHQGQNSTQATLLPRSLPGHDNYYSVILNWRPYGEVHTELSLSYDELVAKVDEYQSKGWRP
ncbi:MAG TPA: DUF1080 domain-containing protein, partial [Planctomycetaceae bacterium]|nr:DUF1080 domain-containing protein [Planctomycetaceae bacterium]